IDDVAAVEIVDGAADIRYSTVAAGFALASALTCADGSSTSVRNSLLVARTSSDEVACPSAMLTNNALEMDIAGNTPLGEMPDTSWFVSYAMGDFHLSAMHPMEIDTAAV